MGSDDKFPDDATSIGGSPLDAPAPLDLFPEVNPEQIKKKPPQGKSPASAAEPTPQSADASDIPASAGSDLNPWSDPSTTQVGFDMPSSFEDEPSAVAPKAPSEPRVEMGAFPTARLANATFDDSSEATTRPVSAFAKDSEADLRAAGFDVTTRPDLETDVATRPIELPQFPRFDFGEQPAAQQPSASTSAPSGSPPLPPGLPDLPDFGGPPATPQAGSGASEAARAATRRRRKRARADLLPPQPGESLDLEGIRLPDFGERTYKRALTLVGMQPVSGRFGRVVDAPLLVAWCLVFAILAVSAWAWSSRALLVDWRVDKPARFEPTRRDLAFDQVLEGIALYDEDTYPKALRKFRKAVEYDATLPVAHRNLAILYAQTKRPQKALEHYERYLELAPAGEDAAAVRELVETYKKAIEPPPPKAKPEGKPEGKVEKAEHAKPAPGAGGDHKRGMSKKRRKQAGTP